MLPKSVWYFMQIVSLRNNLHELSKPIWKNKKKTTTTKKKHIIHSLFAEFAQKVVKIKIVPIRAVENRFFAKYLSFLMAKKLQPALCKDCLNSRYGQRSIRSVCASTQNQQVRLLPLTESMDSVDILKHQQTVGYYGGYVDAQDYFSLPSLQMLRHAFFLCRPLVRPTLCSHK